MTETRDLAKLDWEQMLWAQNVPTFLHLNVHLQVKNLMLKI